MVSATIKLPDGRSATVSGDNEEAVRAQIQRMLGAAPEAAPEAPAAPLAPGQAEGGPGPQGMQPGDISIVQANADAFVRGAQDKITKYGDLAQKVTRSPDENLDAAVEQLKRERAQADAAAKAPKGASPRAFYAGGEIAPDVLVGGASGLGRGVLARSLLGSGAGALSGAAADPYGDLPHEFALGGSLGMAASLATEVPNMVRNVVGGRIIRAYRQAGITGNQGAAVLRPTEDSRLAQIDLMPSEATGSASMARQEARMSQDPGNPKYEALRRRSDQVVASFTRTAKALGATDAKVPTILGKAGELYDESVKSIRNNAQLAFNDAVDPILPLAGARKDPRTGIITGGKAVVPVPRYLQTLSLMRQRAAEQGASKAELGYFDNMLSHTLGENSGRMRLGELQQNLHDFGAGAVGTGTVGKQAVDASRYIDNKQLFAALMDDMDNVAKNAPPDFWRAVNMKPRFEVRGDVAPPAQPPVGPQLPPGRVMVEKGAGEYIPKDEPTPSRAFAGNDFEANMDVSGKAAQLVALSLQRARQGYSAAIQPLNDLQKQGIDQLLGSDKLLGSEEFAKKFRNMDGDQQKAVFQLLEQRRPELANSLRGVLFLDAVKQARTGRVPAGTDMADTLPESIDIPKLADLLSRQPHKYSLLIPTNNPVIAKQVQAGLSVLARINKANLEGQAGTSPTWAHEIATAAQNAVSRNEIFLAKWLTGEVAPHVLERWLYTPEGINALLKVASYQPGRGALSATAREGLRELYRMSTESEQDHQELLAKLQAEQAAQEARARAGMGGDLR